MSFCTMPRKPMNSAEMAPMIITKLNAVSDNSYSGAMRAAVKMPAVPVVADAVHQKGLLIGAERRLALAPEADLEIRDQTHRLPSEEELHEVVGHHQHQHREGEQRDVAEEALIAGVVAHVADGVDVHHQGDEVHHEDHERGEPVDEEAHLEADAVAHHPSVARAVERGRAVEHDVLEHQQCEAEGDRDADDGHPVRAGAADLAAEQPRDDGADERREHDAEVDVFHSYPFRLSRLSTLIVRRLRNTTTRIARPIAASAAATVRMKNTKT